MTGIAKPGVPNDAPSVPAGLVAHAKPVAAVLVAIAMAFLLADAVLVVIVEPTAEFAVYLALLVIAVAPFAVVGGYLMVRVPGNLVGWLLAAIGSLLGVGFAGATYLTLAHRLVDGPRFFELPIAVVSNVASVPGIGLTLAILPLVYPTGRLPGPRWRIVAVATGIVVATLMVTGALAPGPLSTADWIDNPFGIDPAAAPALGAVSAVATIAGPVVVLAAVASLVVRFRRSSGVERQQLKWFMSVAALAALGFASSPTLSGASWTVAVISIGLLPPTIALAILRYRLYDIDRILSRTVSYTLVIVALGAALVGLILAFEAVINPITGNDGAAVALSTLIIAALFRPVARRVQARVDRRFDRSRVDTHAMATRLLDALRDEYDLDRIVTATTGAVSTMYGPRAAGVWLAERTRATDPA